MSDDLFHNKCMSINNTPFPCFETKGKPDRACQGINAAIAFGLRYYQRVISRPVVTSLIIDRNLTAPDWLSWRMHCWPPAQRMAMRPARHRGY